MSKKKKEKWDRSNKKKNEQLGMNHSTASARLKKNIMFDLVQKLGLDICFQCGNIIETVNDLSIEHKIPWLDSEDPLELFFDLDNISFSHLKCNIKSARKHTKDHISERKRIGKDKKNCKEGESWCCKCQRCLPENEFGKNASTFNCLAKECKKCRSKNKIN